MKKKSEADKTVEINEALAKLTKAALRDFKFITLTGLTIGHRTSFFSADMKRKAIRAYERETRELIGNAINQVLTISTTPQAFNLVIESINSHFIDIEEVIEGGGGLMTQASVLETLPQELDRVRKSLTEALEFHRSKFPNPKNQGGRPVEWDWDGAEAYALASFKNNIQAVRGMQAKLMKEMSDYFHRHFDDCPSKSQLHTHAAELISNHQQAAKSQN